MWREPVDSVWRHSGQRRKTTAGPASDMQLSSVSFASLVSKALRPWAKSYGTRFAISPWTFWVPALLLQPYVIVAYTEVVGFGLAPRKIWLPPLRRWTTLRSGT